MSLIIYEEAIMYSVDSNAKQCITCKFWSGQRKVDVLGRRIQCGGPTAAAKCDCKSSPYSNVSTGVRPTAVCPKWEKMRGIK